MCGIAGIIDSSDKNLIGHLEGMLERIYKRGPDGKGTHFQEGMALGMRRLSIIDLEGGQQPFYSAKNTVVAFQNGEIYNFLELTQELKDLGYKFSSHSDTEVIAHGYDAWGARKLFQKLDGMFAIAILDKKSNKLILGRDRFGEKPLYYSCDSESKQFAYSSDLRALSDLPWVTDKISTTALSRYLMLGFTVGEQSIFEDVKKVLPSHFMSLDLNSFKIKHECYYLPDLEEKPKKGLKTQLDKILNESIDIRLRADVPVGVFLSGGVDSSLVAAISAKKHPKIDTFSIGFHSDEHDESRYAKEVAKHIKSKHHHFMFDEESFVDLLPKVVSELDEPMADQACLPTYWLSEEARKHVTVVLSGEGADEVFGGYSYFTYQNPKLKLVDNEQGTTPSGFPLLMSVESCKHFMTEGFDKESTDEEKIFDWIETGRSDLQKSMVTDLTTWLPDDLLVKLDRMAMAHSLEGRAPYLSGNLVDFSMGLTDSNWIENEEYKVLLRDVAREYLPESIFNRPKQGFVLPMDDWIIGWFEKESVSEFFNKREIAEINTARVVEWVEGQLKLDQFNQRLIYSLIVLYLWNEKVRGIN
ncbi:MAG: asparagine synthase (glutamine-hydrolyzing) [Bacteriovoracaceae bacterium]|nr:asparagine synthase (glutamine-hydrolyzing) [Bacteriovoracaceae bacterium]